MNSCDTRGEKPTAESQWLLTRVANGRFHDFLERLASPWPSITDCAGLHMALMY